MSHISVPPREITYHEVILLYPDSNWTFTALPGRVSSGGGDLRDNEATYFNCLWDLTSYSAAGAVMRHFGGRRYADAEELSEDIRDIFEESTGGGTPKYYIKARVYDVIGDNIPDVQKVLGVNHFYTMLKGSKKYKDSKQRAAVATWSGFSSWFNSGRNAMNLGTASYAAGDSKLIWFPAGYRTMYAHPMPGFDVTPQAAFSERADYDIVGTARTDNVVGVYNNYAHNGNYYVMCVMDMTSLTYWEWHSPGFDGLNAPVQSRIYSTVMFHFLQRSGATDRKAVLAKPLGIDRVAVQWFDPTKFELWGYYSRENRTPAIRKLTVNGADQSIRHNLSWVEHGNWMFDEYYRFSTRGVGARPRDVQFFLRDIVTKRVSPISQARVKCARGRSGFPFVWEVVSEGR